jgi:hypothetical protein
MPTDCARRVGERKWRPTADSCACPGGLYHGASPSHSGAILEKDLPGFLAFGSASYGCGCNRGRISSETEFSTVVTGLRKWIVARKMLAFCTPESG